MVDQHAQQMGAMREALEAGRGTANAAHLKIAPYQEQEDIQDFLEAFEGIMKIQKVDETEWVLRLTPLLNGKARTVCTSVGPTTGYQGVKTTILEHYNVNPERCRRRFRALTWSKDQDPAAWIANGLKLLNRWLKPEEGVDKMIDKIAVEQFINSLPQELRIWVASHSPKEPSNIVELIESYDSAHARVNVEKTKPQVSRPVTTRDVQDKSKRSTGNQKKQWWSEVVCHKCQKKGHLARMCTEKGLRVKEESEKIRLSGEGKINGRPVRRIQIDSGASRTIVDRRLVSQKDIGKESIRVTFGNGTTGEYPLARVKVNFDGEEYNVKAAVVQDLAEEVLLGRDVPLHKHIVKRLPKEEQMDLLRELAKLNNVSIPENMALAVTTRGKMRELNQARSNGTQEKTEEQKMQKEGETTLEDANGRQVAEEDTAQGGETMGGEQDVNTSESGMLSGLDEFPFDSEMFVKCKPRIHKTRAERREHNLQWNQSKDIGNSIQLRAEQEKDEDILKWLKQEDPTRIKRIHGIICWIWTPRNSPGTICEQIVLPRRYHHQVIKLAHDISLAGHLGREKTTQKILKRFYWPSLFHDVRLHCPELSGV